jgi:hypothetical protein
MITAPGVAIASHTESAASVTPAIDNSNSTNAPSLDVRITTS